MEATSIVFEDWESVLVTDVPADRQGETRARPAISPCFSLVIERNDCQIRDWRIKVADF